MDDWQFRMNMRKHIVNTYKFYFRNFHSIVFMIQTRLKTLTTGTIQRLRLCSIKSVYAFFNEIVYNANYFNLQKMSNKCIYPFCLLSLIYIYITNQSEEILLFFFRPFVLYTYIIYFMVTISYYMELNSLLCIPSSHCTWALPSAFFAAQ